MERREELVNVLRHACTLLACVALPCALPRTLTAQSPVRVSAIACASTTVTDALMPRYRAGRIQQAVLHLRLGTRGVRNQAIVLRFDPRAVRLALEVARDGDAMAPWSIADTPADALLALNAGQFTDAGPWGWVVHRGREWQAPGSGPMAGAVVIDSAGAMDVVHGAGLATWRDAHRAREAVQSYPLLLTDSAHAPAALCDAAGGLDLTHRDTRLAIGVMADGTTLVVLTRYELPGGAPSRLPIGPTTPEMASLMRRLGAVRALMLDGGLSAQLQLRDARSVQRWPGVRRVPLALVGRAAPRASTAAATPLTTPPTAPATSAPRAPSSRR